MDQSEKKVKKWQKLFGSDDVADLEDQKRFKEVGVILSELESLKSTSRVYEGSLNSVCFKAKPSEVKSLLKKEQSLLKKKVANKSSTSSDVLAF